MSSVTFDQLPTEKRLSETWLVDAGIAASIKSNVSGFRAVPIKSCAPDYDYIQISPIDGVLSLPLTLEVDNSEKFGIVETVHSLEVEEKTR